MIGFLCALFLLTRFSSDPSGRYFVPLAFPLAVALAAWVVRLPRVAMLLVVALVLGYHAAGQVAAARSELGFTTQFVAQTHLPNRDDQALIDFMRARGLRLGLATNDGEGPARAHLAAHGVANLFDFVAGYDSGHGAKPAPGMLLAFAARFALAPARVAMVGDSRHDLMAGRAAGMRTVAVLTGVAEAAELAPLADAVLIDIGGLAAWIEALTPA